MPQTLTPRHHVTKFSPLSGWKTSPQLF